MRIHFSTTAVFPAIRCRCGRSFSSAPFLRAFWTALPFCPFPTLAAFPTIRCRCGATFSSAPFPLLTKELSKSLSHLPKVCGFPAFPSHLPKVRNRPGPSVAPVPAFLFPAASFHLPKVCRFSAFPSRLPKVRNRPGPSVAPVPAFLFPAASFHLPKVCGFSAFPSHLPKVRNRPGPSVAPVPAGLFPAASFHLPKVCRFPVFLSHLPKVRKSRIASKRSVVAFVPFMISSPSEGAGRNGILPPPSHFRYVPIRIRDGSRWSCHGSLPGRCRQRWHITVTFLVSL